LEASVDDVVSVELDRDTMEAVSRQAAAHGLSFDEELRAIVRRGVRRDAGRSRAELIEEFRKIRAMTPPGVEQTPAVRLVREDRDR
jgi:plasmid stability protein